MFEIHYQNNLYAVWTHNQPSGKASFPFFIFKQRTFSLKDFPKISLKKEQTYTTEQIKFLKLGIIVITGIIRKQHIESNVQYQNMQLSKKIVNNEIIYDKKENQKFSDVYIEKKKMFSN